MTLLERLGIYLIIGGVLFATLAGLYYRYEYIVKQNQELRLERAQETENTKAAIKDAEFAKGRLAELDKLQAERDKREEKVTTAINAMRKDLRDLKTKDPVVQKWADDHVPPAVSERLRADPDGSQGDGAGKDPRKPDVKVPRPILGR